MFPSGGQVIEKGACSFTKIRGGVLSAERAKTISARQADVLVQAGDAYAAAALSSSTCEVWENDTVYSCSSTRNHTDLEVSQNTSKLD